MVSSHVNPRSSARHLTDELRFVWQFYRLPPFCAAYFCALAATDHVVATRDTPPEPAHPYELPARDVPSVTETLEPE